MRPHFLWIDNFSKFLRKANPTAAKDVYATCNWTGVAAFETSDPRIHDRIVHDDDVEAIPAMPDNILDHNLAVRNNIKMVMREDRNYLARSAVQRFNVHNVPPKIDTKVHTQLRDRIESRTNTMDSVHPVKLIDINIGSNAGLCAIVRQLYDEYAMDTPDECERYLNLNVDENIYWRILKVHFFCLRMLGFCKHARPLYTYNVCSHVTFCMSALKRRQHKT
jgi:hypothetical protein